MTIVKVAAKRPGTIKFVKMSEQKAGATLALGTYLSSEQVKNFNGDGTVALHKIETDEGIVGLNGTRLLDELISQFEPGDTLEIVFTGKENGVSKDGKKFKRNTFDVSKLIEE